MLLIMEPDVANREALINIFKWVDNRRRITPVSNQEQGLHLVTQNFYDMIVFGSDFSDDLPVILRKNCPKSLLIMSTGVNTVTDSAVDCVISNPPTRLEALACCELRKRKLVESKRAKKYELEPQQRRFKLRTAPIKPQKFIVGLIHDPSAKFAIPMDPQTAISDATARLGRADVRFILVRDGTRQECVNSEILLENDILLLER